MSTVLEDTRPPKEGLPVPAPVEPESQQLTVIAPPHGWQLVNVRELWRYRELLYFLTWRDVAVRYKQTILGVAWAVLQPAMMMLVFYYFFRRLAKLPAGEMPYPLFAFAGLLPWTFFSSALSNAAQSVVGSERLITKIYFPRLAIPFAAVGAAAVDFLIASALLGVLMIYYAEAPSINLWLAPFVFFLILLTATGLGTFFAALNVAYRDFRYVIPFLVQLGLFATPTVYMQPSGNDGQTIHWLLILNPMTSLIASFRAAILGGPVPWESLAIATAVAIGVFSLGCLYFRKVEDGFADLI